MTLDENQLLSEILTRLSTSGDLLHIGFDEIRQWPDGLLNALEKAGLLIQDVQAQSLQCDGCEHGCIMPVTFTEDAMRAFIVCDHPEQQDYMGRIAVSLSRLNQWQLRTQQVAAVLARLLGFDAKPQYKNETIGYILGLLKGKNGRRSAVLALNPLSVIINQRSILVNELLYVEDGQLVIDALSINDALNANPLSNGKSYTTNTDKRQSRKLVTQAMYADWQDAYKTLKQDNPKKTDTWIANQISRMPIGKNKDPETIRKNMKN